MYKHKLVVAVVNKNLIEYHFNEFDAGWDFVEITRIIKAKIKPQRINYEGITDMHGYFEKDGLRLKLEYDGMIGNWMEFKGEQTENNKAKVKELAQLIFDELMASLDK